MARPIILAGVLIADPVATFEILVYAGAMVGAIGLGVAVFIWARKWRERLAEPEAEEAIETYRHMLDDGLIDPAEFARIEARLHDAPVVLSTDIRSGPPPTDARPSGPTDVRSGLPPPRPPSDSTP